MQKKQLEESTGKKRDELLAKMKSCIIESDVGKIFIGSTLLNTNKFYITDVKVLGSEGYGVKLIVNGNMVISPKDVSFNFGYGGLKTVPDVVVIDKDDIDFVTMIKKGDERWVEVVLNSALTRLKEISRTSLNEQQKQKFDEIISQLKHVGIEPLSSQDGIYQFRAEKLSNDRIDKYEEIIKNTDELSKSVFNEGLVREVKLKANGKEYKFCGYLVRGYPTTISSTYRYPQSLGRLDAKFFEYISVKYDHDIALSLMKHLKPSNSSLVLSCYQALYSAFVDNSVSSNFEEFVPEKGLLERAKKEIKSAQELIKQVLYTTPKKIPLPADSNIVLMGKKQTHIYFPSLVRRNVEIPYKFLNKFERNALSVILNPTQENLEKYYRSLEQITFTKDGVLRSVFEVSNDTVYNFALVVPRGGMDYTTVEISPSSLIKFEGGQKLINDLKSGRDVYAIILRHPLISPDTVAVVKLKLSDTAPLKVHPVLWSVLKGDFDKDSAVVVTSYEMQQTLSSAFRKQQISFTAKLDEKIAAKKKSLAEDYSVSVEDIKKSFDKAKPVVSNDAFNTASAIGIALRILTGDLHWSLYELREFVRTAYEQGDITPQQYLKYTEILWKIEQQPISGKKLAEIFNEKEKEMLNNSKLTIAEKLGVIEKAFERNGLNVVLNLTKWQDRKNVTPVSLGLLLNWQDYVSENAKLSSKDLNEFVVLTNEYFNMRRYGLSKYREGIITEMTRAELLKDVPAGWHTLNSVATVHPLSYWEVALKENVGLEITPLPSQIVIEPQHPQSNPSTIPSTEGIFLRQGKEVTSSPRLVEDNVGDKVVSPLPQEKEKFIFIQKGFPVNLDKGIIIVDKLSNARKFNDFVFTPGEIKKTIEVYNKSVSGKLKTPTFFDKRQNYLVQKLGYDKKTDEYFAIANNEKLFTEVPIVVKDIDEAIKYAAKYGIKRVAINVTEENNERRFWEKVKSLSKSGVSNLYLYFNEPEGSLAMAVITSNPRYYREPELGKVAWQVKKNSVSILGKKTMEDIDERLSSLKTSSLRAWITRSVLATSFAVTSIVGIKTQIKQAQQQAALTPTTQVEVNNINAILNSLELEEYIKRVYQTMYYDSELPVKVEWDNLSNEKKYAIAQIFEHEFVKHFDQNCDGILDVPRDSLFYKEVEAIGKYAVKCGLGITVGMTKTQEVPSAKVEKPSDASSSKVTQPQSKVVQEVKEEQTPSVDKKAASVEIPVKQVNMPQQIDDITINTIAVKRGDPSRIFVKFNNGLLVEFNPVKQGDTVKLKPRFYQVNQKFVDFVTSWYLDWYENDYNPILGNGGYEEFNSLTSEILPEVDVVRRRDGKYIVSLWFGDAIWTEREVEIGERGGIYGLEFLPKDFRDFVKKEIRGQLGLPTPPPKGGGITMNMLQRLVDKAQQGDEHAREFLRRYREDNPNLYYRQITELTRRKNKNIRTPTIYIVVSNAPQVGKTLSSYILAEKSGARVYSTSDMILERVAKKYGITPKDIKEARKKNPENYRADLILEGNKMAEEGTPPGVVCLNRIVENGDKLAVIEGIRRAEELKVVKEEAKKQGYKVVTISVLGISQTRDNTEFGMLYDCDYLIFGRGIQDLKDMQAEIDNIISNKREIPQHWVQKYKNTKEFVVVDLETTGLSRNSQIIQIAVLKCKKQGNDVVIEDKYVSRVRLVNTNLDRDTVETIKRITGIDLTETANEGKDIKHVLVEIEKYLLNYPVVMHNAAFDLEIFNYWRQKYGLLPFTPKVLFDTKALAKYLYPASETHLETLAEKYGIQHTNPHDAENDALVTAKVFNKLFVSKPRVTAGLVLSQQTENLAQTFVENIEFPPKKRYKNTMINKDLKEFLKNLNKNKVKYLIVGGYAHAYYTEPRYTKDLDILIEPTKRNAKMVYKSICEFFGGAIEGFSIEDFLNPDKFFVFGVEPNRIDIFSSLPGIDFSQAWKRKVAVKFGDVRVWVT